MRSGRGGGRAPRARPPGCSVVPAAPRRPVSLYLDGELAAVAQPQHDAAVRGHEAGAGERHDLVDLDRGALRRLSPERAPSSAGESNPVFPGPKPGPVTVPSHSMCEGVAVCSLAAYHTQTVLARSISMSSATTPRCSSHRGLPCISLALELSTWYQVHTRLRGPSPGAGSRTPTYGFGDRRASVTPHPSSGPGPALPCRSPRYS